MFHQQKAMAGRFIASEKFLKKPSAVCSSEDDNKPQTSVPLRLLGLRFLCCSPKFYLIKTELGQVDGIASSEEESKQENNADYFGTGRVPSPVRGGWNPNIG